MGKNIHQFEKTSFKERVCKFCVHYSLANCLKQGTTIIIRLIVEYGHKKNCCRTASLKLIFTLKSDNEAV